MQDRKIFNNAKWIIGCKIVQSLIQFIVGVISARYLGPASYGLINYAASVVAFVIPVMQLGMQSTLVQEYMDQPDEHGEIIGTHLVLNTISAVACFLSVVSFVTIANPGDSLTIQICALYSISLFSRALEMLQYWFQARLLSKYSSLAMLFAYVLVSAYKVFLLITRKSVYWFALSHAIEYGGTGLFLLIAYARIGKQRIRFSWLLAKKMVKKSRHYIVAMLMLEAYCRIGSVLLTQIIGETENGYLTAAITCTSITTFVFMAIIDTARPVVLESRKQSQAAFERNVARTYGLVMWLSLAQSVFFTIFAKLIIKILYGADFMPAVPVLQILVWNTAFSYMGYVRNIWILGEEKHGELWKINLGGAIASIALNCWMIPLWGACGAAAASVLTQIFTNVIMGLVLRPIRRNSALQIRGLDPRLLVEMARMLLPAGKEAAEESQ